MGAAFIRSTLTLTAATAARLSDLLATEGYLGSMVGSYLELEDVNSLGDVYYGDDNTVSSANGRLLTILDRTAPPAVDPSRIWLKSATGGDISCHFEPGGIN